MDSQNPWDHLRQKSAEPGLAILRERYKREPSGSHIVELGVAYLWVGDYQEAEQHFRYAIKTHPTPGDIFYGMAGAAKWCTDEPGAAVRHWHAGLDSPYAVGGVGIHLPLLLFLASILRPGVYPQEDAARVLLKRIEDPRVKYWPGPLAKFVLGLGDEKTLSGLCTGANELDTLHRKWLAQFYKAVLECDRGTLTPTEFKTRMQETADTSRSEWSEEGNFLSLLWSEEFFIARYEASPIRSSSSMQAT